MSDSEKNWHSSQWEDGKLILWRREDLDRTEAAKRLLRTALHLLSPQEAKDATPTT